MLDRCTLCFELASIEIQPPGNTVVNSLGYGATLCNKSQHIAEQRSYVQHSDVDNILMVTNQTPVYDQWGDEV